MLDESHYVKVAPHAGAWIEIDLELLHANIVESLPMRERGLKSIVLDRESSIVRRSPCGSVD